MKSEFITREYYYEVNLSIKPTTPLAEMTKEKNKAANKLA